MCKQVLLKKLLTKMKVPVYIIFNNVIQIALTSIISHVE